MLRLARSFRLPLLLTLALVPALAFAAPKKKSKSGPSKTPVKTSVFGAELLSVETLADGKIDAVFTSGPGGTPKKFLGCGMQLSRQPHLLLAFEPGFVVTIKAEDHCIKTIYVARSSN